MLCAVAALASCANASASQDKATALCKSITTSAHHLVASFPTTVGQVRTWRVGPGNQPGYVPWATYNGTGFAAWCWIDTIGMDSRSVMAASPGKTTITFVTGNSAALSPNPDGPAVP